MSLLIVALLVAASALKSYASESSEQSRCIVDVRDANSVDETVKSKGCRKGDILFAQFFYRQDGTFPKNESPATVAAKNCDFTKQILIEKEKIESDGVLKDIAVLACVLDDYHHFTRLGQN